MIVTIEPRPILVPLTHEGVAFLPVKGSKRGFIYAMIDREDYGRCCHYTWRLSGGDHWDVKGNSMEGGRAVHKCLAIPLSHFILSGLDYLLEYAGADRELTHQNGNKLDFSRRNLIPCVRSNLNTRIAQTRYQAKASGWPLGVARMKGKRKKRWRALIRCDGRNISLGVYSTPIEAAAVYHKASRLKATNAGVSSDEVKRLLVGLRKIHKV